MTAVVLVHLALAYALLGLSGVVRLPRPDELTQLIALNAAPPPPIVEVEPEAPKPKKTEAPASPRISRAKPTGVAPKPRIDVPSPHPIVASPTPRTGAQATQGASNVVGPGTGAGGSGNGTGSGGAGNGNGGGGSGIAARASLMSPSLRSRDFPPYLRGRLQGSPGVFVIFTVEANGRVYNAGL